MTSPIVLRDRFVLDDRTFTVVAEPWFDAAVGAWLARFVFLALDRSHPRPVSTGPVLRHARRDELERRIASVKDTVLLRSARAVLTTDARRTRAR
ncbi:MAG TPA: hypothetical protein VFK13_12820 [Gemmatimonadaceae bacterium]|nr:hypothetical protein [Gemmatimonadaceae bacterium]